MSTNPVGRVLLRQFRVDAFIASGGMGAVYKVWDLHRNVYLAMKTLHAEYLDDPSVLKYFRREAIALKKLSHPNVLPFYGLYETDDLIFFLEGFIDGMTLQQVMRAHGRGKALPINDVLSYLRAISAALGYAHVNGVVHCDIKPGNIMVDKGGNIYLADFGIARHAESTTTTLASAGTPAYMAPEQIVGKEVNQATDIYSLGVLAFELLTGKKPFEGTEVDESQVDSEKSLGTKAERIRYAHLHLDPPDITEINPKIHAQINTILMKALSKNYADRYQTTHEFFSDLCSAFDVTPEAAAERVRLTEFQKIVPDVFGQHQGALPGGNSAASDVLQGVPDQIKQKQRNNTIILGMLFVGLLSLGVFYMLGNNEAGRDLQTENAPVVAVVQNPETRVIEPAHTSPTVLIIDPTPSRTSTITIAPSPSETAEPTFTITPAPTATPTIQGVVSKTSIVDGMVQIFIPGGDFLYGENSLSSVHVNGFWIDQTEVTNAMYAKCVSSMRCLRPSNPGSATRNFYYDNPEYADHPVIYVTWEMAQTYCQWASRRLPTDREWEKAARWTDGRTYPWGESTDFGIRANFCDQNCPNTVKDRRFDDGFPDTAPVGSFPLGVSPYGVLDMAGNVWEWTSTPSRDTYIIRGGSWDNLLEALKSNRPSYWQPAGGTGSFGIRCVEDPL